MALVLVTNMVVLDNPTSFLNPFQFEITFEALSPLAEDLEWKVTYVGSAEDSSMDQVLDEVAVGPVPVGVNKFVLQADAPDPSTIPQQDILGVTVVLVTCSYLNQEFCRVGYYVNNDYTEAYDPETGPNYPLEMNKVVRQILADKPRVTRFPINWNGEGEVMPTDSAEGVAVEDDNNNDMSENPDGNNNDDMEEEEDDDMDMEEAECLDDDSEEGDDSDMAEVEEDGMDQQQQQEERTQKTWSEGGGAEQAGDENRVPLVN